MAKKRDIIRYIYNPSTLMYERKIDAKWKKYVDLAGYALAVLSLVAVYFWFYTYALGLDLPKTASLKKKNAQWQAQIEILSHTLDQNEAVLAGIEQRDDDVYRTIFGLDPIPQEVKNAGFGGTNRYAYLDQLEPSSRLRSEIKRMDVMTKRAYLQSRALDEIAVVSRQAEDMVSCVPAVPPILPQAGTYRISSPYGRRSDPIFKNAAFHEGIDLATTKGNPVYATGNGTVERVRYQHIGYGYEIMINHGFGYKTRYAHLSAIDVKPGQSVIRGDRIGAVGNTGKSTGPHLHYEVIYKGKTTNPYPYMDLSMGVEEFKAMVKTATTDATTIWDLSAVRPGEKNQDSGAEVSEEIVEYGF